MWNINICCDKKSTENVKISNNSARFTHWTELTRKHMQQKNKKKPLFHEKTVGRGVYFVDGLSFVGESLHVRQKWQAPQSKSESS